MDTNSHLRVLVAEDHAVNQEVIKAILSHHGFTFKVVDNGVKVIELLTQESFDVILMDMQMPEMDGCQTTREIRQREQIAGEHVRIIAITANSKQTDREICLAAGMDDYITKPIDPHVLINKLKDNSFSNITDTTIRVIQSVSPEVVSVFNDENLKGRVLGQTIPSIKMAQMFLRDLPNMLMNLDAALAAQDIAELSRLAHRMGGVAAMIGAEQLALLSEELEADAQVGATKNLAGLTAKMHLAVLPLQEKLLKFIRPK